MKSKDELWRAKPDAHDYLAAEDFLSLILSEQDAKALAAALREQPIVQHKVKDILRAAGLPVLDETNRHVRKDIDKVKAGERLSPALLVRGDLRRQQPLIVADGYHRICAIWHLDEDAYIHGQIVALANLASDAP